MSEITRKTKEEIYERDKRTCALCGRNDLDPPHHCFKRSEYHQEDKNKAWNLILICHKCHRAIHHGGVPDRDGKRLDKKSKLLALRRYNGNHKDKLEEIMKKKYYNI